MYADDLERADVEYAVLHGIISRKFTDDPRGPRYRIAGRRAMAGRSVSSAGLERMMASL
jgi:hypothetical protein